MSILRIRRSQLISKHGVGSVFPGTDGISRLTAGLDKWFTYEYDDSSKNINKDFDPLTDVRGSADYRRKVAQNLVMKYGYELTGSFVPNLADRNQVENLVS